VRHRRHSTPQFIKLVLFAIAALAMAQELNFSAFSNSLPPQNVEAAESILGGILLDPEAMLTCFARKPSISMLTKTSTKLP
jgi:hypothetical protein